jgi:thiamine kinase-like enzyme
MILGLKGNSGCDLTIVGDKIRKSCQTSYNNRLEIQCKKQADFNNDIFTAPKVYESGIDDEGKFFFNMQFVQCKTFDKVFNTATKDYLDNIIGKLLNFTKENTERTADFPSQMLISKYESVKNNIRVQKNINVSYLDEIFYSLDETINIPVGYCHGDLTFSNLLFDGDNIVLLDFLDTYLDSPIQDIVKLRQDTKYHWSIRMLECEFDRMKLTQCLNYIDEKLDYEFSKNKYYVKYYTVFQILNLLRIVPYCKEQKNVNYLINEVDKLCQH